MRLVGSVQIMILNIKYNVYDINTDQWGQLPPPGHFAGVPHIIGGKLAIIGGRLSASYQTKNK